ncbi:L-2-hydroxyglutarate oxidase LhgO [Bradyrhizobium ottawaense]
MDKVDCVVIGAGVVGLAVARKLAQAGREVIVLEEAEAIGTITSSRNSEVIHAGIYYRAGSWMARMCVDGKHALYRYCAKRGIPHKNCGKLIVATSPQETEKLQSIKAHAEANGVLDMQQLTGEAARALEPALACDAARCCRHRRASSTATPTCSRCAAKPRKPARRSRFTRR